MTGKELIYATFQHKETPRLPWVPFTGVHAGLLKGYNATEVLKDSNKLFESLLEVHRLYMPDGLPICFDLQMEAEIFGCNLIWADNNPPSVTSHPLADTDEIPAKTLSETDGRIPVIMDAAKRIKKEIGNNIALYGLICGPFTLASHLRGTKLFMDMKKNTDYVKALIKYCAGIGIQMAEWYINNGMDIIAPVDPLVSQISPKYFEQFLAEPYTDMFIQLRKRNVFSSFFVCGNALRNIEEMCKTNPDGISIDENIPMATAKEITDRYNICIGGNIPLTTTMLFGNQQDNMKFIVDMVDSLSSSKNLIVSPGCDMPYNIPIENTIAAAETVRDIGKYRDIIKNYQSTDLAGDVKLPDYAALKNPLIEAFTLDSDSCAACAYMWAVVKDAKAKYGDGVDIVEYKYTTRNGIAQCVAMGVKNLPSLYINGKLAYASIIPSHEEFFSKIESYMR